MSGAHIAGCLTDGSGLVTLSRKCMNSSGQALTIQEHGSTKDAEPFLEDGTRSNWRFGMNIWKCAGFKMNGNVNKGILKMKCRSEMAFCIRNWTGFMHTAKLKYQFPNSVCKNGNNECIRQNARCHFQILHYQLDKTNAYGKIGKPISKSCIINWTKQMHTAKCQGPFVNPALSIGHMHESEQNGVGDSAILHYQLDRIGQEAK